MRIHEPVASPMMSMSEHEETVITFLLSHFWGIVLFCPCMNILMSRAKCTLGT